MILYSKITNVSDMEDSLKMMQSFYLNNYFSIFQVMGLNEEKSWNRPQNDSNAINL